MDKKIKQVLAENVRRLMAARGLDTQVKLAKRAGIGSGSVWRIRHAQAGVTLETLEAIASALDVDPQQLLTECCSVCPPNFGSGDRRQDGNTHH